MRLQVLLLVLALTRPLAAQQVRTASDSAMGRALKLYRVALGLTQTELAALTCFPAPCTPTVTATKISRIERMLDSGTTAQQDSLVRALDREFHRLFPPGTERRVAGLVARNRIR